MPKTCIFCGGGGPFSEEHVLPEWSAQLLKLRRTRVTRTKFGKTQKPYTSVGSFGTTVGAVCKRICNNGWMSDLETLTKPVLSRLLLPKNRVRLSPDEQVVLASWLWKLAIVHEYGCDAVYFNDDERQCLRRGDAPTQDGVQMWIAGYRGELDANISGGPCTFSAPDGRSVDGYLMSMSLHRFAAQVLCVRPLPGARIATESRYRFAGAETMIWPENNGPVTWPPPAGLLDQALFRKWHRRWNNPRSAVAN